MRLLAKVGFGVLGTVGGLIALGVAVTPSSEPRQVTVAAQVDGDTFDVSLDGSTKRIRLLNIDAPESVDPHKPVQCLGPEASRFLAAMLPIGTPVRIEFDKKREDQSGRTLAAAFTPDGRMVNAEVARAGFARVVTDDDNVRFRPSIERAAQEGADGRRGLHSPEPQCTLPARVAAVSTAVAQAPTLAGQPPNADSGVLYTAVDVGSVAAGTARSLLYDFDHAGDDIVWAVLTVAERSQLRARAQGALDTANTTQAMLRDAAAAAKAREDGAAQQAARAEADRVAREQAAAQTAEQQRAAAEAQRQAVAAGQQRDAEQRAADAADADAGSAPSTHTGHSGHPCLPGERDGDRDGYCGEGR